MTVPEFDWLDATNLEAYLRRTERLPSRAKVEIRELAGGVSNEVLYVRFPAGEMPDFVVKQARPQLRTKDPWYCTVERIWREVAVLEQCRRLLDDDGLKSEPEVSIPRVLFQDREAYLFAMTAAPPEHIPWKTQLLAGDVDPRVAGACGRLLGKLHARSWGDAAFERELGDRSIFDQLRLEPYYRFTARRRPEAAQYFARLVEENELHQHSLVHADFSPKNLLVYRGGLMMIDFETGHYGDGAFDLGFFTSHLMLKAFHHAPRAEPFFQLSTDFWKEYVATMRGSKCSASSRDIDELLARGIQNFAGCAWARIDGTSKVDYFHDPLRQELMRQLCLSLFRTRPRQWENVLKQAREILREAGLLAP